MERVESSGVIEDTVEVAEDRTIYVAYHDVSENGMTVTLSLALAAVSDLSPTELVPRFSDHVDPDALNRLFRPLPNGNLREGGPLHLTVEGYEVTIHNTGRIEIEA